MPLSGWIIAQSSGGTHYKKGARSMKQNEKTPWHEREVPWWCWLITWGIMLAGIIASILALVIG